MTAANPRAPFRVANIPAQVIDADGWVVAEFRGPDGQARAEALAAEYEQTYGPEFEIVGKLIRRRSDGTSWTIVNHPEPSPMRDHICRLLNEHGGPQ